MLDGKRGTAQRILYSAFDLVERRSGRDALEVFEEAINNIMPVLEVKARRVGGSGCSSTSRSSSRASYYFRFTLVS